MPGPPTTWGPIGEMRMGKLDDASFHMGADDFPDDAPEENGATHIGMFLTWAIRKGLFASPDAPPEAVEAVRTGKVSGREFVLEQYYGQLLSEFFTPAGAAFATQHYEPYLADFGRELGKGLKSEYLVEDSRENYEAIAKILDQRWEEFQRAGGAQ
jgi:hypothetical protein